MAAKHTHESVSYCHPDESVNDEEQLATNITFTCQTDNGITESKLKCCKKWKLWMTLFLIMTIIAIAAVIIVPIFVEHVNLFKTKSDAMTAEHSIVEKLFNGSNVTDYKHEAHQIFDTFDINDDEVWDINEFADHLYRETEREAVFNEMDRDHDNILSFREVTMTKRKEPMQIARFLTSQIIESYYNYSGAINSSLYYQYSATLFFNIYGASEKGYITRYDYYQYHVASHFNFTDSDSDGFIDFAEFFASTFDQTVAGVVKTASVIKMINETFTESSVYKQMPMKPYSMYPLSIQPPHVNQSNSWFSNPINFSWHNDDYKITCLYTYEEWKTCYRLLPTTHSCITQKTKQHSGPGSLAVKVFGCDARYVLNKCFTNAQCYTECLKTNGCGEQRRRTSETVDPRAPQPPPNGQGGNYQTPCFGPNNEIVVKDSENEIQTLPLKKLQVGDYVQSKTGKWTKVWWIKVRNGKIKHLNLYYENNKYITVTPNHLLYVNVLMDEYMQRADEVTVGTELFVMDQPKKQFVTKKIVSIEETIENITYAPITMDGSIVVSNVLASAYENSYKVARNYHDAVAIGRFISQYISETLAVFLTDLHYYLTFGRLQKYNLQFVVYNWYTTPFIVIVNIIAPFIGSVWIYRGFSKMFQLESRKAQVDVCNI